MPPRRRLVKPVLEQQPAARLQMQRRGRDDVSQRVETVRAAYQRQRRLVAQRVEMWVAGRDVGWIADDDVEAPADAAEPVALRATA